MARFNFTARSVQALESNAKRTDYYDSSLRLRGASFGLRVSGNGAKEYFVRYRDNHRLHRRMSIGDANLTSLADAREKAREIAAALDKGKNPADELAQYKRAETVTELCEDYLERHAKFKKDKGAEDRRKLNTDVIPLIGKWKIADVRRRDIISLIERVSIDRGATVSANRLRALLSKLFRFALERELIETSPCAGLPKRAKEYSKHRVLTEQEIKDLWQYLDQEPPTAAAALRLILLTGQRPMEVAGMEWSELKGGTWHIPAIRTKNGKAHTVPLSALALRVIETMIPTRNGRFVFPGARGEHVSSRTLQNLRARAIKNLPMEHFCPHDLRRTCATNLRKLGASKDIAERLLNHTNSGVTDIYDRYDLTDELATYLEAWAERLAEIVGVINQSPKLIALG